MKQLVQLQENLADSLQQHNANVLVVFREESEGQQGLEKVVAQTKTPFTLALDSDAKETGAYSPGRRVHDSYIVDAEGVVRAILKGMRYDRAQANEFEDALDALAAQAPRSAEEH